MHKFSGLILSALGELAAMAVKFRNVLVKYHCDKLAALVDKAEKEVEAWEAMTAACAARAEKAVAKADDTAAFVKAEAAKHGVTLSV